MRALLLVVIIASGCDNGPSDVDKCARALMVKESLKPGESFIDGYADGCAWIYKETLCRAAWLNRGTTMEPVASKCAKAYCNALEFKPAFCNSDQNWKDARVSQMEWPLLHRAILDKELGESPALLAALRAHFAPIYMSAALPLDAPRPAGTEGAPVQTVFAIELHADGSASVDGKPVEHDMALSAEARRALAKNKDVRAVIRAAPDVKHERVMRVLDALKQAGVAKIAFGVALAR